MLRMNRLVGQTRPGRVIYSALDQLRTNIGGKRIEPTPELTSLPKQPRAFDLKAFRTHLRKQKISEEQSERRVIMETHAKSAPEGWTILTFLEKAKVEGDLKDVADKFGTWEKFITTNPQELFEMKDLTNSQRKAIWKYVKWFNHGLWPRTSAEEYMKTFAGKPMIREGQPWSSQEDALLKQLVEELDVSFGDAFLTISWRMQRRIDDVRERYIEKILKPAQKKMECELGVTHASRPLLMNRKFRLDVPFLYIVPTEKTHKVKKSTFSLPKKFEKFRIPELFGEKTNMAKLNK